MTLRLVDSPTCPDCDGVAVIPDDGPSFLGRPIAILGHRTTCPTLRVLQRQQAAEVLTGRPRRQFKRGRR